MGTLCDRLTQSLLLPVYWSTRWTAPSHPDCCRPGLRSASVCTAGRAGKGPCTLPGIKLSVKSSWDLLQRLNYSRFTTVELTLQNSLVLSRPVVLDRRFSCTILRVADRSQDLFIRSNSDLSPALIIANTSNVMVVNISFGIPVTSTSPNCPKTVVPESNGNYVCPAISVWRSYGVQIAQVRTSHWEVR